MNTLKTWFWTAVYKFKYRIIDPDVCCCGSSSCDTDMTHAYTNAKQYAIEIGVKSKVN